MNYREIIEKCIDLWNEYIPHPLTKIKLGTEDYESFTEETMRSTIKDVPIECSRVQNYGIYFYGSFEETIHYSIIMDDIGSYALEYNVFPNRISLSSIFVERYEDTFKEGQELFGAIITISESQIINVNSYISNRDWIADTTGTNLIEESNSKDKFIDWLLNDDDALLDAMESAEEKFFKIDRDFEYFIKEMEFEKWLKENDK